MPEFELELDRVATGGAALGTGPDGRVVFVRGGLPGERVAVRVTAEHARRLEADVTDVLRPSDGRRQPPCPHVHDGCGGCDWQHATPDLQRELRRSVVRDCLRRLAGMGDVDVRLGPSLDPTGYRTTVRAAVVDGRAGYRAAASHRIVQVGQCSIAHPLVEEILVDGRFGAASEVTIRAGANTGERIVVARPSAEGLHVPDDVTVVGTDELDSGRSVHYHEEVAGRRLQISAASFFQCRPDGAEVLVQLARDAIGGRPASLLDAYCGVGLFGAVIGSSGDVVGVESSPSSAADARVNYAADGGSSRRVVRSRLERWRPRPVDAVVADPARSGLGKAAVKRLTATRAEVMALVSCDPASLARDAGLLADAGYRLDHVTVVDLFGQTSHVETVSRFVRSGPAGGGVHQ